MVVAAGGPCAIALLGAAPTAIRIAAAEAALAGGAAPAEVADVAAAGVGDGHRRALLAALVRDALRTAAS